MNPNTGFSPVSSVLSLSTPARSPDDQLAFRIRRRGDIVVASVRGEADAFTLALWRQKVREAVDAAAAACGALIIDATRLDFLSLRTLASLAEDAETYQRDGIEICLVTPDLRLARLAGGDSRTASLFVRSTVVGALTALQLRRQTASSTMSSRLRPTPRNTLDEPEIEPDGHVCCPARPNHPTHVDTSRTPRA
jgi:anti-anti-sigma factor